MPVTEGRHRTCYSLNLFLLAGNIKMLNFVDEMVIKR